MSGPYDWKTRLYLRTGLGLWSWRPYFLAGAWRNRASYQQVITDHSKTDESSVKNISLEVRNAALRLVGIGKANVYRRDEFHEVSRVLERRLVNAPDAFEAVESFFSEAPTRLYQRRTQNALILQRGTEDRFSVYGWADLPWGCESVYIQLVDLEPGFVFVQTTYVPSSWLERIALDVLGTMPRNYMRWNVRPGGFSFTHSSDAVGSVLRDRIGRHIARVVVDGILPGNKGLITNDMHPAGLTVYWAGDIQQPEGSGLLRDVLGVSALAFWGGSDRFLFGQVVPEDEITAGNVTWLFTAKSASGSDPSIPQQLLQAQMPLSSWLTMWRGVQQIRILQHSAQAALASLSWRSPAAIRRWRLWRVARRLVIQRFRAVELQSLVLTASARPEEGAVRFFADLQRRGIGRLPGEAMDLRRYLREIKSTTTELGNAAASDAAIRADAASSLLSIRAAAIMQALTLATTAISILALVVAIVSIWLTVTAKH